MVRVVEPFPGQILYADELKVLRDCNKVLHASFPNVDTWSIGTSNVADIENLVESDAYEGVGTSRKYRDGSISTPVAVNLLVERMKSPWGRASASGSSCSSPASTQAAGCEHVGLDAGLLAYCM
mmetsp:Transcript_19036/g.60383  ORF Transcript_19036/g.60383 Transcript_19036/m.60383 type:complete len:124 (+) Transcript_19036:727-1098(+)